MTVFFFFITFLSLLVENFSETGWTLARLSLSCGILEPPLRFSVSRTSFGSFGIGRAATQMVRRRLLVQYHTVALYTILPLILSASINLSAPLPINSWTRKEVIVNGEGLGGPGSVHRWCARYMQPHLHNSIYPFISQRALPCPFTPTIQPL